MSRCLQLDNAVGTFSEEAIVRARACDQTEIRGGVGVRSVLAPT